MTDSSVPHRNPRNIAVHEPIETPIGGHYGCEHYYDEEGENPCSNAATHEFEIPTSSGEFTFRYCPEHAKVHDPELARIRHQKRLRRYAWTNMIVPAMSVGFMGGVLFQKWVLS